MSEPINREPLNNELPIPWQIREWELTEAELEAIYRVATNPNSTVGRLKRTPKRVPSGTPSHEPPKEQL